MKEEEFDRYIKDVESVTEKYFRLEELCPTNHLLKFMERDIMGGLCFVRDRRIQDELFKKFGKGFPELEEIRKEKKISKFDYDIKFACFALKNYNSELKEEICQIESRNIFDDWGVKI